MIRMMLHTLILLIILLHSGCYAVHYELPSENPILQLEEKYSVYVDSTWTAKQAEALLNVLDSIPPAPNLRFSQWRVSDDALENGIKIELKEKLKFVTISSDLFPIEEAQDVSSPSKQLYYAAVQFITENGTNRALIESILQNRYGIYVPSYASLTESTTSKPSKRSESTTNETSKRYSDFENEDLMHIIAVLEEFPRALQKTSQLRYIVRRIDKAEGLEERGISYAQISRGCIEFAESTFLHRNSTSIRRVIAHEKAHFLWAYVFNHQLKADWRELAGWYQDSTSESGWSTTKERSEFVSNYAHEVNPNEDMAESIAHYIVHPVKFRSLYPEKYEFIHNRIMLLYGERYAPFNVM